MNERRRICVVTGSRSEYGLLYWLIREISEDPALQLQLIVTGMHLAPEFGLTYKAIEADGFVIDWKIDMLLASDSAAAVSKSVGLGMIGFADAFAILAPNAVVVLGDRFEILAASQSAMFAGLPLIHISGGEVTQGAIDDSIRHAITKMARYHFVATDVYRRRVIQLGETPENVFNVGDPGLDNIARLKLLSPEELGTELEFDFSHPFVLVTYHPVTTDPEASIRGMHGLLESLDGMPQMNILLTRPNADAGGRALIKMIDEFAATRNGRVLVVASLGQLRYLSAMRCCQVVVGNSSSGIVEAPALRKPVVNIGSRQTGRLKASCIIDCQETPIAISAALQRALSAEFSAVAAQTVSLYGNSSASTAIRLALHTIDLTPNIAKLFYDSGG